MEFIYEDIDEDSVMLIKYNGVDISNVVIPETYNGKTVTDISNNVFNSKGEIITVSGESIRTIRDGLNLSSDRVDVDLNVRGTFESCTSLVSVYFPNIEYIGDYAFAKTGLITFANSNLQNLTSIGEYFCNVI